MLLSQLSVIEKEIMQIINCFSCGRFNYFELQLNL